MPSKRKRPYPDVTFSLEPGKIARTPSRCPREHRRYRRKRRR